MPILDPIVVVSNLFTTVVLEPAPLCVATAIKGDLKEMANVFVPVT